MWKRWYFPCDSTFISSDLARDTSADTLAKKANFIDIPVSSNVYILFIRQWINT